MTTTTTSSTPAIRARRVSFDWESTPVQWIPDDPGTSHVINVLHLLLPAGERWFVNVYREAMPLVTDPALREQVKGFMGQEAVHARAHQAVLDHYVRSGVDVTPYTNKIEWFFQKLLAPERVPRPLKKFALRQRLAVIAAIEHFTCVLGFWILQAKELDEADADATMLDLLRWHGAEEVEHRTVAFDLAEEIGGPLPYARRVVTMAVSATVMAVLWFAGTRFLIKQDPEWPAGKKFGFRDFRRAARRGRVPYTELVHAAPRYMKRSHHPSQEGDLGDALAYLARSPGVAAHS